MFYCPKCGKVDMNFNPDKHRDTHTYSNCRDGYGRPIMHFECDCGNLMAGWIITTGCDKDDLEYYKDVITEYNEGGLYVNQELLDLIKKRYEQRKGNKRSTQ
jgi:DNA polymerase II large subunit